MTSGWHLALRTGIEVIDDDHQRLFALVGEFNAASDGGGGKVDLKVLTDVLGRLQDYVLDHFQREEQLQIEAKYDGYEENRRQHQELVRTLDAFAGRYGRNEETQAATREMREFLAIWLSQHIAKTDIKMRGRILPWAG